MLRINIMYLIIVPEDYIYCYPTLFKILDNKLLRKKISGVIIKKNFFSFKKIIYQILINDKLFLINQFLKRNQQKKYFKDKLERNKKNFFLFTNFISNEKTLKFIKKSKAKKLFIISCDEILKKNIINYFDKAYNLHCSNLPKSRGLFPLFFSIINRDKFFYISIHEIDQKIDNGDIVIKKKYKLYTNSLSKLYEDVFKRVPDLFNELVMKKKFNKIKNDSAKKTYNSYPSIKDLIKFFFIKLIY